MRALTFDELYAVAGGQSTGQPTEVVVEGKRRKNVIYASQVITEPTLTAPGAQLIPAQWQRRAIEFGIEALIAIFSNVAADQIEKAMGSKSEVEARDENSNFDATGKTERTYWDSNGAPHTGFEDPTDGSFWTDTNHNGIYETHTKVVGGNVWMDSNNSGGFDKMIWNNSTGSLPQT